MLLLAVESFISGPFNRLGYLAPFVLLLAAGVGLPLPEEVTMVGSGFLLHQGRVEFPLIVTTCVVATLLGDSIPFWLGRKFGSNLIDHPNMARIFHAELRALIEKRFARHGNWGVFTCRFLPGIRLPGFFTAGTLGMSYPRFILIDGIGALIMTPIWILVGRAFGKHISSLEDQVTDLNQILGFTLMAVLIGVGVRLLMRKRQRQVQALEGLEGADRDGTEPGEAPGGPSRGTMGAPEAPQGPSEGHQD